ncbi:hypothetical protein [Chelatococcus asaccharovorans]|uniref:Uncharacterized protein n=1 Tax=Chelatococcus asaccharovorans TaxID=28210 RepID=A0A2V3UAY5_9HYPH|nr:hypothetical protein [Chelatococcus asaccharovorans]MBS7703312.1 hypothetical protein [Chelatococcus asaccharovorans]PXW61645.1 hypothetical protein C7450_103162 [Chelatococcus asaccharovorans]
MKGWKAREDAARNRRSLEASRQDIREIRRRHRMDEEVRLAAEAFGDVADTEAPGPEPTAEPEPVPVPPDAVVDPEPTPDRFSAMADDDLRLFLAQNGVRPDGRWSREKLIEKARAVQA